MTEEQRNKIIEASKEFASKFKDTIGEINGSGWLIVDPLSGFLNSCGYKNILTELPATIDHPQVLIMTFEDGSMLIPAGADIPGLHIKNWMWL